MMHRKEKILNELKDVINDLSGLDRDKIADQSTFLDLGFDSLFLAQMSAAFKKKFAVNVTFRQLLGEAQSPEALADYIDSRLPPEPPPIAEIEPSIVPTKVISPSRPVAIAPPARRSPQSFPVGPAQVENVSRGVLPSSANVLERVMSQQLRVMAKQLEMLRYCQTSPLLVTEESSPGDVISTDRQNPESAEPPAAPQSVAGEEPAQVPRTGPWKPIDISDSRSLNPIQRKHLDDLVERYTRRTSGSKELTAAHRPHLADPRVVAGFRSEWKEMVYPIVSARSSGSKLWDVDGNEYVDMMMGFGPALFGHSPDFVVRALEDQIKSGIEIGPQSPLVGKLARLVCDFTGMERVTFCNTGSEAVLAALRVARTVTGRSKIAVFAGSYHGIFDEVLVRPIPTRDGRKPIPAAPGIPAQMVQDVIILRYGDPDSLDLVRRHADELAAVLVEPVQSRHPDLQPKEFLRDLRKVTAQQGIALIFDEVITGFRLQAGGSQAWFGVEADLATYGKALGGGMPIGALAGKARFMDALDGGAWNYGDNSVPEVGVTYFAGTFVRHPLAIAAGLAVLHHLKEAGPQLYQTLNERASRLAKELNEHFEKTGGPIHIQHCGSLFCITFTEENRFASLLFFYLRLKGVHIWEGRPTFISTAHSDEDLAFLAQAMKESVAEMQVAGFLPSPGPGGPKKKPELERSAARDAGIGALDSNLEQASKPAATSADSCEFPLTEAQMEIWLATGLGTDASRAFNENILLQFKGTLNIDAMRFAVQRAVHRHEALRTTFSHDGSYQRVNPPSAMDIALIDLSQIEDGARRARFDALIAGELQQPFDLVNGPLVRATVVRLEPDEHFLLITAHHIVCDGWSIHVLLSDLSALYRPAANGDDVVLPDATPLREYAAWQIKQQSSAEGLATERYWLERFKSPVAPVKLPPDRTRPPFRTFNGNCERLIIEKALHTGMKQLGASQGCTAFTTFLAAFKVLLHRLTAQQDIVVGIAIAGQSIVGIDLLVGHCVNTLPLSDRIEPNQRFTDFLKSVNRTFLDAYEHQNYTYGTLVKKLKLGRDPSQTPLISVMFNMDQELQGLKFRDLDFELHPDPNTYVNFELSFNLFEKQGRLILDCEYNKDLFDANTIRRWMGHYENLLREIVADPGQPIATARLMSQAERQQLLLEWNRTERPYPKDSRLHQLIEAQAGRTPDAVAAVCEDKQLTYRDLNERGNQLAHYLRGLAVGPDTLVGICMERSLEMIVGLLGVLKAGGAYVPLDPEYPKDRLGYLIQDCRATVLLTQQRLAEKLPRQGSGIVCLDSDWHAIASRRSDNPINHTAMEHLAYVIYTSGSTGNPKGVMVPHGALVNFMLWMQETFPLDESDRVLQKTPVSFDASVWEFFAPLLAGAQLVLARPGGHQDPAYLTELIQERQITALKVVPSLLRMLLDEPAISTVKSLRRVFCGGEALTIELQRTFHARLTAELANLYGPTEATIDATFFQCQRNACDDSVPIGRPIANTEIYILDGKLEPVPIGIVGELYIGGASLARGYLNRPDLNGEKFACNPFASAPGGRLYRTGDLARLRADGNVEYLGRIDHQVKLRGFRIELGEIETTLREHPTVADAVVIARDSSAGDRSLVAYLVAKTGTTIEPSDLRLYVKQKLPQYMIPAAFVQLSAFPLIVNGKLDRRALPPPTEQPKPAGTAYAAPRNDIERRIERIWRDVLGMERLGTDENFFDIGGHSILATRAMARLRQECRIDLPLRVLFEYPTIAELGVRVAAELKANRTAGEADKTFAHLFELRSGDPEKPVFFLPGGAGGDEEFLVYARFLHHVATDHTFYGLRARSADGMAPCQPSVARMAADYIEEITRVQPQGPYLIVGNCTGGIVAHEIACQLEARGQKIALLALMDTDRPTWRLDASYRWKLKREAIRKRLVKACSPIASYYYIARLSHHCSQMRNLNWREVMPYLLSRVGTAVKDITQMRPAKPVAADRYVTPVDPRKRKIQESHERTLRRHRPSRFQGRMTLIVNAETHERNPDLGWSDIVSGGVEICKATGDHQSYIREHVQALGEQFRLILERAKAESPALIESEVDSKPQPMTSSVIDLAGFEQPSQRIIRETPGECPMGAGSGT